MNRDASPRGLRLTPQRRAILEVLRSTDIHPEAGWIYQEVRKRLPSISLGTVYRNLGCLAEAGLIQELALDAQLSRWDGRPGPHYHVRCVRCRQVVDIDLPGLAIELDSRAARASDFAIRGHTLHFVGLCSLCKANAQELDDPIMAR